MSNEAKTAELLALGEEIAIRRKNIIQEWLKTHERPQRGIMAWEEQKKLDEEARRRYQEILDKYNK